MAWECTPEAGRKLDKLISRLIREDMRLCETEESASSLALQTQALSLKKNNNQPGKFTKFDHKKRIENLKKKTKCAACKEKGHWARECPSKSLHIGVIFFTTVNTLDETRYVKIADDKVLPAAGKGTIVSREKVLGKTIIRQLENVLFVVELSRNLFSIGTINDKKFSLHSYQTYCEVRDKNGQVSSRGVRHGKLFKMLFEIEIPVMCNVMEDQKNVLKLWHERLGHVNLRVVTNTSKALAGCDFNVEK